MDLKEVVKYALIYFGVLVFWIILGAITNLLFRGGFFSSLLTGAGAISSIGVIDELRKKKKSRNE